MNGASMWGRPIKVGRPTQAQPYIKTIESTINDTKKTTCLYVSNIHPVSFLYKSLKCEKSKWPWKSHYHY